MNKSKKFTDQIRGELKPLLIDISKDIHMTEEPVCEICGQIRNTRFLMDIIDIHELWGRHPKAGMEYLHPGACEPLNMIPVHRMCHSTKYSRQYANPSAIWIENMKWLSSQIMKYRVFTEQVQWDDLLQAVRHAKRDWYKEKQNAGT